MALRSNTEYEKMAKLAIDIYCDYDIKTFPINSKELARKMGINFIYYSDLNEETRNMLMKFSNDGANLPHMSGNNCVRTIYINDDIQSDGRKDTSGLHEIKHILNYDCETFDEEENKKNEEMATFFAKYMKCPIPYLIYCRYDNEFDIVSTFGVSQEMAKNVISHLKARIKSHGYDIFDYEVPLLETILGDQLDRTRFSVITS